MKETTKTSRVAGYLEKMFRAINADSFAGELEEPIITIIYIIVALVLMLLPEGKG